MLPAHMQIDQASTVRLSATTQSRPRLAPPPDRLELAPRGDGFTPGERPLHAPVEPVPAAAAPTLKRVDAAPPPRPDAPTEQLDLPGCSPGPNGTLQMQPYLEATPEQAAPQETPPTQEEGFFHRLASGFRNLFFEPDPPARTTQVMEALLADPSATIARKSALGGGINTTSRVRLSNGGEGVWKPSAGEDMSKLRDNLEEDHQARREASTYIVDKYMNHFAGVPPTIYRELDGEKGAIIAFVRKSKPAASCSHKVTSAILEYRTRPTTAYERLAVLDNVIGNLDRHAGNWMIDEHHDAVPIDHGLSFPLSNGAQGWHNYDFHETVPLSGEAKRGLQNLIEHRAECSAELEKLIDKPAVAAMFERVENMLQRGTTYAGWREGTNNSASSSS